MTMERMHPHTGELPVSAAMDRSAHRGRALLPVAFGPLDLMVWATVAALAMIGAYHPYFFGDEISPLRDATAASGFLDALARISTYKPRLVFNAIWALGGVQEWPRAFFAGINALSLIGIGACAAHIVSRWFAATRGQVWLLLATILLSRFSAMIYFDYVSGIIETLSLCTFLCAVLATSSAFRRRSLSWLAVSAGLATAAVLVHERYMAATFALGCVVACATLLDAHARSDRRRWLLAVAVAVVPAMVFLSLTKLLDALPVSTGTSAETVTVSLVTLKVFFMYLGNIFLGTNFGKEWFVGSLHMGSRDGFRLAVVSALAFLPAWVFFAKSLRSPGQRMAAIAWLMLVGAMVVMASLPGDARQEARWMYPVGVFIGLLVFCTPRAVLRYWLLGMLLALSVFHWASGALNYTVNVYTSRTAQQLANGINSMTPPGRHALLIGLGEGPWEVGHQRGVDEFVRRNLTVPVALQVQRDGDLQQAAWADVGVVRVGGDALRTSRFAVVGAEVVRMLADPSRIDERRNDPPETNVLGGAEPGWGAWRWSRPPQLREGAVVLETAAELAGFIERPVHDLEGRHVSYRARLLDPAGASSRMRLQINWMAEGERFLSASIQTVDVQAEARSYSMRIEAPEGAVSGLVYANLHDDQHAAVLLERVELQMPVLDNLGQGSAWNGWQWHGEPAMQDDGVVLGPSDRISGFRELDAGVLDDHLLVYRAALKEPGATSWMRLQINWMDGNGVFIDAAIQAVEVREGVRDYPMLVVAPAHAKSGLVYANLHDGQERPVLLKSVDLIKVRQATP